MMDFNESLELAKAAHSAICLELNMDGVTKAEAWEQYEQTSQDNTLEVSEFDCTHYRQMIGQ